jgi:hypothetical protein
MSINGEFQRARSADAVKSLGGDAAMIQGIHDAAVHIGAECVKAYDPDIGELDDAGLAYDDDYDESGADDGANKAFQLRSLQLRLKALRR